MVVGPGGRVTGMNGLNGEVSGDLSIVICWKSWGCRRLFVWRVLFLDTASRLATFSIE